MLIIATKYIDASIELRNIFNLVKNPINGGKPAIENNVVDKINPKILLDLMSEATSAKSLFAFLLFISLGLSNRRIDQIQELDNI